MPLPAYAQNKVREYGIDAIIDRLGQGTTQTEIAREIGVSVMAVNRALHADPLSSARVAEAQKLSAERFELHAIAILEEARQEIRDDPQISGAVAALARERAQAAWRQASIRDRDRYSDKRGDTINIDARKQIGSITLVGVPAREGGGVRGGVGGPADGLGVLPSTASSIGGVLPSTADVDSPKLISTTRDNSSVEDVSVRSLPDVIPVFVKARNE